MPFAQHQLPLPPPQALSLPGTPKTRPHYLNAVFSLQRTDLGAGLAGAFVLAADVQEGGLQAGHGIATWMCRGRGAAETDMWVFKARNMLWMARDYCKIPVFTSPWGGEPASWDWTEENSWPHVVGQKPWLF